ncbi:MAG: cytochrome P450, partial [Gammaproteobacteria bacterium]|nr:cytochrome P450 [Gammaproteobacteria bacterium]
QHVLVEGHRIYDKTTFQYRLLSEVTGDGLLTSGGTLWRERRRIQQPAFHHSRLALVAHATSRATERMWQRWTAANARQVDVASEMMRLSLDVVLDVLFGMAPDDRSPALVEATVGVLDHLIHRSRSIPGVPSWASPWRHRRFLRSLNLLDQAILDIIDARRRAAPTGDEANLLDLLIAAEQEQRISPARVRNEMLTMIIAGHETVASALTWCWSLLANRPDLEDRLAHEADRSQIDPGKAAASLRTARNTVSEALRLYPPAWLVSRSSTAGRGSSKWLPKGTLVLLSPYVTQRHAAYWSDPESFEPDRFDQGITKGSYFPFGTGPRQCIGRDFALVEAVIVLSEVSKRCRLKPVMPARREYAGVTLQPEGGLKVAVVPR